MIIAGSKIVRRMWMRKKKWIMLICISVLSNAFVLKSKAVSDQWVEELKSAVGLSVGSLDPRFPDLEAEETGVDGYIQGKEHTDLPVDVDKLDPNRPDVVETIREWISIAEPPQNASEGTEFRYDKWGRIVGRTADGATIRPAGKPDYALATPEATAWSLRKKLDSVNHCTLEEYVIKKLNNRSIADCGGRYRTTQMAAVPNLKGRTFASAKEDLERAGFIIKTSGKPAPSKKKEFTVAAQKPEPGARLKKGQTVELVVFGPFTSMVTVSDLTGLSLNEAKSWLKRNGLKSKQKAGKAASSKTQEFTVASQNPAPGSKIEKGQTVEMVIFGPYASMVTVSNLAGLSLSEAKSWLKRNGLKSKQKAGKAAPSKKQEFTVASQDPAPGFKLKKGDIVELVVFGPIASMVTVPDVARLTADEAKDRLDASGLKARIRTVGGADSKRWSGRVKNVKPGPGTKVALNTEVVVSVYGKYVPTREELVAEHDCSRYAGTRAYWDNAAGKPGCRCVDGQIWSKKQNRCIRKLSPNEICSRDFPGSIAKGRTSDGKINCACPNGFGWTSDRRCVRKSSGSQGIGTGTGKKKPNNQCAASLVHIRTQIALTNDLNRELAKKLLEDAIRDARRDGCTEEEISAVTGGVVPGKQTGGSGGGRTGGGGGVIFEEPGSGGGNSPFGQDH